MGSKSRPMRARGLKHLVTYIVLILCRSRPMRARGLKLDEGDGGNVTAQSRPMRARGLKLDNPYIKGEEETVAPHAGAWVETEIVFPVNAKR